MNAPCSGEICIIWKSLKRARVSAISQRWTSSGGVPWATMYSAIAGPRKKDFGSSGIP